MYISMFEAMTDNAYMQERAADIRDVTKRILSHLLNVALPNPALIDEEVVQKADPASLDGKTISFTGCFTANDNEKILITPVELEAK